MQGRLSDAPFNALSVQERRVENYEDTTDRWGCTGARAEVVSWSSQMFSRLVSHNSGIIMAPLCSWLSFTRSLRVLLFHFENKCMSWFHFDNKVLVTFHVYSDKRTRKKMSRKRCPLVLKSLCLRVVERTLVPKRPDVRLGVILANFHSASLFASRLGVRFCAVT